VAPTAALADREENKRPKPLPLVFFPQRRRIIERPAAAGDFAGKAVNHH
jgi:hypothetical protein